MNYTTSIISNNGTKMRVQYTHEDPAASVITMVLPYSENESVRDRVIQMNYPHYRWCRDLGLPCDDLMYTQAETYYTINPGDYI